jgi:hypothetical protein
MLCLHQICFKQVSLQIKCDSDIDKKKEKKKILSNLLLNANWVIFQLQEQTTFDKIMTTSVLD